jgi:hypothetical protein
MYSYYALLFQHVDYQISFYPNVALVKKSADQCLAKSFFLLVC